MHNILIIDDEEDVLVSLKRLLENKGYAVTVLARPETAFNMIHVLMPDIILLDIKLAELDGRDICMQLKSNAKTKKLKIILFSGLIVSKEEYTGYGADDFIEKPIHFPSLLKKLKLHLSENINA
jgi:DNA-binding response OmpR family regulator